MVFGPENGAVFSGGGEASPVPGSGPGLARLAFAGAEERPPFFQARVSRMDAPEHIDEISFTLLDLALAHGGEYQGWSCSMEM